MELELFFCSFNLELDYEVELLWVVVFMNSIAKKTLNQNQNFIIKSQTPSYS